MFTDHDAATAETYRPGYNPAFVKKVMAKRRKAENDRARAESDRIKAEAAAARERSRNEALAVAAERAELKRKANEARHELSALKAELAAIERDTAEAAAKLADIERAKAVISAGKGKKYTYAEIEAKAIILFGVTKNELRSHRRNRDIVFVRQFIMYWASRMTELSTPLIGKLMGGFDHTTILHGKDAYVSKRAKMGRTLRNVR